MLAGFKTIYQLCNVYFKTISKIKSVWQLRQELEVARRSIENIYNYISSNWHTRARARTGVKSI